MNGLKDDPINPFHYRGDTLEAIQVIEDFHLDFYNGTVVLYMLRAGRKDGVSEIQDLRKAKWYLDRKIERLEREEKEQMGRAFSDLNREVYARLEQTMTYPVVSNMMGPNVDM